MIDPSVPVVPSPAVLAANVLDDVVDEGRLEEAALEAAREHLKVFVGVGVFVGGTFDRCCKVVGNSSIIIFSIDVRQWRKFSRSACSYFRLAQ